MCARLRPPEALKENARKLYLPVSKIIPTRMHANSDTHAPHMRVLQENAISFTSIDALFKQSQQIKWTVNRY